MKYLKTPYPIWKKRNSEKERNISHTCPVDYNIHVYGEKKADLSIVRGTQIIQRAYYLFEFILRDLLHTVGSSTYFTFGIISNWNDIH